MGAGEHGEDPPAGDGEAAQRWRSLVVRLVAAALLCAVVVGGLLWLAGPSEPQRFDPYHCDDPELADSWCCPPPAVVVRPRRWGLTPAALGVRAEARSLALLCSVMTP